jgi:hypothetical protein
MLAEFAITIPKLVDLQSQRWRNRDLLSPRGTPMTREHRILALVLRCFGGLDCLALAAVLMPHAWMAWGCSWSGLAEFPSAPLAGYLARSVSALYALHGATVVFLSFDVVRYRPLIRFLAQVALLHGGIMLVIDVFAGMPWWWQLIEGPLIAASGVVVLLLLKRAE